MTYWWSRSSCPGSPLEFIDKGDGHREMAASGNKLTAAVEEYLAELRRIRATGGGTGELSYYPPLHNLLNAVGGLLRPKVHCVSQLAQQGAGHPDFGLYAARQVSKGQPKQGQTPEGGVVWRSRQSPMTPGSPPTAPRSVAIGTATGSFW